MILSMCSHLTLQHYILLNEVTESRAISLTTSRCEAQREEDSGLFPTSLEPDLFFFSHSYVTPSRPQTNNPSKCFVSMTFALLEEFCV